MHGSRQSGTFPAPMDFTDLDEGRALYGGLMDVFVEHTGGRDNPEALERVEKLCAAAVAAIEDVECRVAIRGVASYSKLLFSDDGLWASRAVRCPRSTRSGFASALA